VISKYTEIREIGHPGGGQTVTNEYTFNYSEQNTGFTGIYMPDLLRSEAHLMITSYFFVEKYINMIGMPRSRLTSKNLCER